MSSEVFKIEGIVHVINDVEVYENQQKTFTFKKQSFVVLASNTYTGRDGTPRVQEDYILLECHQDSGIYQLTGVREGNRVLVLFTIQGREGRTEQHKGKYYNTLKAFKIDILESTTTEERAGNTQASSVQGEIDNFVGEEPPDDGILKPQEDDLPF